MNLLAKFNLIFVLVLAIGLTIVGYFSRQFLHRNAREQVHEQAKIMMDTALAVRHYTTKNIKPILESSDVQSTTFHSEVVPAFSATEVFLNLREIGEQYVDYSYKEAVLNPTNPRDQARGWEEDIVNEFRSHPERKQIRGERENPAGDSLFLAQPLVVGSKEQCLACHDRRDDAPPAMIKAYSLGGTVNGFGWKVDEIIGAQIVSVPVSRPVRAAEAAFRHLMIWLVAGGLATLAILDAVLYFAVIRPIKHLAKNADAISKGQMEIPELPIGGAQEISVLAVAFNRMHRSLAKAMKLIDNS